MKAAPFPLFRFSRRLWLVVLGTALASIARADIREDLAGTWDLVDESPALMHPSNPESFTIAGSKPEGTNWADGVFFLRWEGDDKPERGYYSLKTGRVWLTTYRYVEHKRERVEYRGAIERDGSITWSGSAQTTGSEKTVWAFTATKR